MYECIHVCIKLCVSICKSEITLHGADDNFTEIKNEKVNRSTKGPTSTLRNNDRQPRSQRSLNYWRLTLEERNQHRTAVRSV